MAIKACINSVGTWTKFRNGMCHDCKALCCHLPVEVDRDDLVTMQLIDSFEHELGDQYALKKLNKEKIVTRYERKTAKFILAQTSSGACLFLDKDSRCSIYENRPKTCREHPHKGPRPGFCAYQKKL